MKPPFNKFTLLALIWFIAGIYALIFRESGGGAPPFPHFDKVAHFLLFFGQLWLIAKAYISAVRPLPYRSLLVFALLCAVASEVAQALFTQTRQGDWLDAVADLCGSATALWLAHRVISAKQAETKRHYPIA